jgi:hypothetical protein
MAQVRYLVEVKITRIASWERCDLVLRHHDFPSFENFVFLAAGISVILKTLAISASLEKCDSTLEAFVLAPRACNEPISAPT